MEVEKLDHSVEILIAIPDRVKELDEWERVLELFEDQKYLIYELSGIDHTNFDLGSFADLIAIYKKNHENIKRIVVITNARDLIFSWYRCYNSLVNDFIYFVERESYDFFEFDDALKPLYYNLTEFHMIEHEKIDGKIYCKGELNLFKPLFYDEKYFDHLSNYSFEYFLKKVPASKRYILNGDEYLFDGNFDSENEIMINFDKLKLQVKSNSSSNKKLINLKKYYHSKREQLVNQSYKSIISMLNSIEMDYFNMTSDEKKNYEFILTNEIYLIENSDMFRILIASLLFSLTNKDIYIELIFCIVLNSNELSKYNKFFVYYQCVRYIFLNNKIGFKILELKNKVYEQLYQDFLPNHIDLHKILKFRRNSDCIFIFTSQLLGVNHSPTKIALDVCEILSRRYKKKVFLINTKEVLTTRGYFPFKNTITGNSNKDWNNISEIKYKDSTFRYYQPSVEMPDDDQIKKILSLVSSEKPYLIINVGSVLIGDICSELVPTVTLPMGVDVFSKSSFLINFDEKMFKDYSARFGRTKDNTIFVQGAFELKQQNRHFTKKELGIPENKFIILIVGNRLDEEIDESFLHVLNHACKKLQGYVLFVGNYSLNINSDIYEALYENNKKLGFQEELMAIIEHADLYINPKRSGGGISAIYALYAGKPVVTLEYGDVFFHTEKTFSVSNYEEMRLVIERYATDHQFYKEQSLKAQKRGNELTNFENYISNVFSKTIQNDQFF